jgi:hypothetical protein
MDNQHMVMDLKEYKSAPAVIKTICCVCHEVLKDGPEEPLSHGYCSKCMRQAMVDDGIPQEEVDAVMKELNLLRWRRIYG